MVAQVKKKYNKYNWNKSIEFWPYYTSPFRPSKNDVEIYSNYINKIKNKKALVLGATPEIREILSLLNYKVVVVDASLNMIREMLSLGYKINTKNEKWIVNNWLKLVSIFKDEKFDIIIGDLVLRNIDYKKQEKFLFNVSEVLNEGGLFVTRIHYRKKNNISSDKIVEKVFNNYLHFSNKKIEDIITSRLFDNFVKDRQKKVDKKLFSHFVESKIPEFSNRKKKIFINIYLKWGRGPRTWTQRNRSEVKALLKARFDIKKIVIAKDYIDSDLYPIYILQKNAQYNHI
ncbi:MAG: class I SAM-dependent methyltransferase [Candidatus Gastranaerophilaceae bacterium]|jgi:ubiquinone/menaquinone biosynthesis C-methylase UbiE